MSNPFDKAVATVESQPWFSGWFENETLSNGSKQKCLRIAMPQTSVTQT